MCKPTLLADRAQRDEVCCGCGYPFDSGDSCLVDNLTQEVYCGNLCAENAGYATDVVFGGEL